MTLKIPNDNFCLSIQNPLTGDWVTVPPIAGAIYNPRTEATTGLKLVTCEGSFELSAKQLHALSRPRGVSLAHWRKIRRERRLDHAIDIHVAPEDHS